MVAYVLLVGAPSLGDSRSIHDNSVRATFRGCFNVDLIRRENYCSNGSHVYSPTKQIAFNASILFQFYTYSFIIAFVFFIFQHVKVYPIFLHQNPGTTVMCKGISTEIAEGKSILWEGLPYHCHGLFREIGDNRGLWDDVASEGKFENIFYFFNFEKEGGGDS